MPNKNEVVSKQIHYNALEDQRLFMEVVYRNIGGVIQGHLTTPSFDLDITEFLETSSIGREEFRQKWNECEWENQLLLKSKEINMAKILDKFINDLNLVEVEQLKIQSSVFSSLSFYSRMILDCDILVNVVMQRRGSEWGAEVRVRS